MFDAATPAGVPLGRPGQTPGSAQPTDRAASDAPLGPVRARIASRGRWAAAVGALLVAALLAVFAYVIANSQTISRHEAAQRFQGQATIAAGLTDAIFSTIAGSSEQQAAKTLSGPISPARLSLLAGQAHDNYVMVTAADGALLAASAGAPRTPIADLPQVALALEQAKEGRTWFSDVLPSSGSTPLVVEAIPFATPSGRRIEVVGSPVTALFGFFSDFLRGALPVGSSHGLIVDSAGRILGSSVSKVKPAQYVGAGLLGVLRHSGVGQYHSYSGARYVVTAPIDNSSWRVAITEPVSELYPGLVGSQRWIVWLVFAAFALAGAVGVFLLSRVLSGASLVSRQSQQLRQANAALTKANAELDAFSYSVSHDLRAPLRAIDGFSRIVVEEATDALTDEQRRYLGLVRDNAQKMGELIDDLLALSRVTSRPLERQTVVTNDLVAEVRRSFDDDVAARVVEFTISDLPDVQADRALLRQVFANLIGNALKYSRESSPAKISVTSERDGGETVFTVRDNGVGFDMRYAEKLFEVFQRLHRAEDYEGTGVGLAIVARIVARHGGRVWADSSPGEGAVFHFTLGPDAT